ncbi:MAG: hypothetical protein AAF485_05700, partial [Chloroflexota bacterium]
QILLTAQRIDPILLVIVTRPLSGDLPEEYEQLRDDTDNDYIILESLPLSDTVALVCQRLRVSQLPEQLADLIYKRTEGNPFFGEELAYTLQESGIVTIDEGECRISSEVSNLQNLHLPDTVQGVVTSRIDRLTPTQQMTLKVASVIGRDFGFNTLHDVHPIDSDKEHLPDSLDSLTNLDITEIEAPPPALTYTFKQMITHEVTYNMMLFAQRRELHRAVAEWYETTYSDHLDPFYPMLAYHWRLANDRHKTVDYLEKAGDQALFNYANEEAIEFFGEAIALVKEPPRLQTGQLPTPQTETEFPAIQRGSWSLSLGQAYVNWAKYNQALSPLEEGVALLGYAIPASQSRLVVGLIGQMLQQFLNRLWPKKEPPSEQQNLLLDSARAYEGLTTIFYFANQTLHSLYSAFRSLNLAEAAGPSPELARGYASVGVIVSFIPIHSLAESYCLRALALTKTLNNLAAQAWVSLLASVYYAGVGRWTDCETLLQQVIDLSDQLGDVHRHADGISNLAVVAYFQGDHARCLALSEQLFDASLQHNDSLNQGWALRSKVYVLLSQNKTDEALTYLQEMENLMTENAQKVVDEALTMDLYALQAVANSRQGKKEDALKMAEKALNLMNQAPPSSFLSLPGYTGVTETYFTLWQADPTNNELKKSTQRALKALQSYARVFQIGKSAAHLWRGKIQWELGRKRKARNLWAKSAATAEQLQMPYWAGQAHYEMGIRLSPRWASHRQHLDQAETIFTKLGSSYHLERMRNDNQS